MRALNAYVAALSTWRGWVDTLNREREAQGLGGVDIGDERQLYRVAQGIVGASYLGDIQEEDTDEFPRAARHYLLAFDRLLDALEGLTQRLKDVSGEGGV